MKNNCKKAIQVKNSPGFFFNIFFTYLDFFKKKNILYFLFLKKITLARKGELFMSFEDSSIPHYNTYYPDSNGEYHNPEWYDGNIAGEGFFSSVSSAVSSSASSFYNWVCDSTSRAVKYLSQPGNAEKTAKQVLNVAQKVVRVAHRHGEQKNAFENYRKENPSVKNSLTEFGNFIKKGSKS